LHDYDAGQISTSSQAIPGWALTVDEARTVIAGLRSAFPEDDLLGNERGGGLEAVIGAVYQSFGGHDLYPTQSFGGQKRPLAQGAKVIGLSTKQLAGIRVSAPLLNCDTRG
jgi:hypothetical protein